MLLVLFRAKFCSSHVHVHVRLHTTGRARGSKVRPHFAQKFLEGRVLTTERTGETAVCDTSLPSSRARVGGRMGCRRAFFLSSSAPLDLPSGWYYPCSLKGRRPSG